MMLGAGCCGSLYAAAGILLVSLAWQAVGTHVSILQTSVRERREGRRSFAAAMPETDSVRAPCHAAFWDTSTQYVRIPDHERCKNTMQWLRVISSNLQGVLCHSAVSSIGNHMLDVNSLLTVAMWLNATIRTNSAPFPMLAKWLQPSCINWTAPCLQDFTAQSCLLRKVFCIFYAS